jgi:hypothetical protein
MTGTPQRAGIRALQGSRANTACATECGIGIGRQASMPAQSFAAQPTQPAWHRKACYAPMLPLLLLLPLLPLLLLLLLLLQASGINVVVKTGCASVLLRDAFRVPLLDVELGSVDAGIRGPSRQVGGVDAGIRGYV